MSDLDGILIFPHISMDGDALGSSAALCLALKGLGKKAYIMVNTTIRKYIPLFVFLISFFIFPPAFQKNIREFLSVFTLQLYLFKIYDLHQSEQYA